MIVLGLWWSVLLQQALQDGLAVGSHIKAHAWESILISRNLLAPQEPFLGLHYTQRLKHHEMQNPGDTVSTCLLPAPGATNLLFILPDCPVLDFSQKCGHTSLWP